MTDLGSYGNLSVSDLKDLLLQRSVDFSRCIEKQDLVELCRRTAPGGAGAAAPAPALDPLAVLVGSSGAGVHHDIAQNTRQWFHMRRGDYDVRIGGSEIGVVVGVSPYAKPYSLYEKIIAQTDGTWVNAEEEPEACVHGHYCEPLIAGMYQHYMLASSEIDAERQLLMREGGYYQSAHPQLGELYGASPDRRIVDPADGALKRLLEIKAPFGRMYTTVKPEYMAQVQYQMWCSGADRCDFIAVKLDHELPEKTIPSKIRVFLARVYRSEEYITWMLPRLFFFSKCLILRQCPPRDLYESEATGLEMPPKVRVEEVLVENGAWRIQECA